MAEPTAYQRRQERVRQEGRLEERERQLSARTRAQEASNASGKARSKAASRRAVTRAPGRAAGAARGVASRSPYLALSAGTATIALVQLTRNDKLTPEQKHAALFAIVLLVLIVSFVGELSPEIATGFSALLFASVLLGGTDAVAYIFETIPKRLLMKEAA